MYQGAPAEEEEESNILINDVVEKKVLDVFTALLDAATAEWLTELQAEYELHIDGTSGRFGVARAGALERWLKSVDKMIRSYEQQAYVE